MPIARIQVIEGVFSDEQLGSMITKVTEAMIDVEGEAMREKTWVIVEEVRSGLWAIGGSIPKLKANG
ncbi:MAG: tautomerase family protein [Propionibacteriaceae bacterium]|nr:tautomerase family protein [Propionibacteriaceae bacterium]